MQQNQVPQRPTVAEIDLGHLSHNVQSLRNHAVGSKIMAIVKANAYGHGLIPIAKHLETLDIDQLGVAFVEEGIALRQAGIQCPILVLGGIFSTQIEYFLDYDLEITVSSLEKLNQVESVAGKKCKKAIIHLKFDTGMERVGVHYYSASLESFIVAGLRSKWCYVKGIYSHLACADDPNSPITLAQLDRFNSICDLFCKHADYIPIRHLANSGGIIQFPQTHLDMIRPGIILYGVYPSQLTQRRFPVKPLLTLKSNIVYFKVVESNCPISYGATWQSDHRIRVITVPIGYGDGYRRACSNRGSVLIHGKRYPIVGRVCMDQFMVNIEWDSAYNGDEVVLIGKQGDAGISIEEVAENVDTIPYEILTGLNERIPRVYI